MSPVRRSRLAIAASAVLALTAVSHQASADPTAGVDSNLYRPAFDSNGVFTVESAKPLPQYDISFKIGVGFSQKPLHIAVPGISDDSVDSVIDFALGTHFTFAMALTEKVSFGIDAGLYRTNTDEGYGDRGIYGPTGPIVTPTGLLALRPFSNFDPAGNHQNDELVGPYDARLGLKYAFWHSGKMRLAALATLSAPFGDEDLFLGDTNMVFEPKLAFDYALDDAGSGRIMLNLGARIRERTVIESFDTDPTMGLTAADAQVVLDVGSEAVAALGASYEILPQLSIGAEATFLAPLPDAANYGKCRLNDGRRCDQLMDSDYFADTSEGDPASFAMAGVVYRATPDVSLSVIGGAGLLGARNENFRLMTGVVWQPTPAGSRVIGRGDTDNDGIPDSIDICGDEPEDKDGYQDDDGCPDLDNDGDGIIDASDACPDAPEDKDGHQDDDGCPERDNDGDGVPDVTDRCPNDKEDKDGFEDDDGCPDEDNDGDGFPDGKDQCPNEAETTNGFQDTDGCPDKVSGGPQMDVDRIDLQGSKVAFSSSRSSKLTRASRRLLDQVAELLKKPANRNKIIRIESHVALGTKSTQKRTISRQRAKDKSLTSKRARVVQDYLVRKGVKRNMLRRDTVGSSRPLRQPATDRINDRIEFIRQ